ncbi:hypothetical protein LMG29542_08305 [Paraburkholderia humisilvae]|uniref:Uncharacterized protein n=1 Tax=Paraburkholderia humisilvae TaxID=627669 RepID=A0A6J5F970_9BURK|nr:hypothetical protein LMG29542_08305 [Paraburkholderia humisilvae]
MTKVDLNQPHNTVDVLQDPPSTSAPGAAAGSNTDKAHPYAQQLEALNVITDPRTVSSQKASSDTAGRALERLKAMGQSGGGAVPGPAAKAFKKASWEDCRMSSRSKFERLAKKKMSDEEF